MPGFQVKLTPPLRAAVLVARCAGGNATSKTVPYGPSFADASETCSTRPHSSKPNFVWISRMLTGCALGRLAREIESTLIALRAGCQRFREQRALHGHGRADEQDEAQADAVQRHVRSSVSFSWVTSCVLLAKSISMIAECAFDAAQDGIEKRVEHGRRALDDQDFGAHAGMQTGALLDLLAALLENDADAVVRRARFACLRCCRVKSRRGAPSRVRLRAG